MQLLVQSHPIHYFGDSEYLNNQPTLTEMQNDIISAAGIDYSYPEDGKLIRGFNYPSGIVCLPVPG